MNILKSKLLQGRYKNVDDIKAGGEHYTPKKLSDFIASQIIDVLCSKNKDSVIRILDPGVGDGELLISLVGKLQCLGFSKIHVFGFETSKEAYDIATSRLKQTFPNITVSLSSENFLEFVLNNFHRNSQSDLFRTISPEKFDLIISNPPYVRTQIMGAELAQKLSQQFGLSGRVDLYHAFLHGMAMVLKPGGIVGVIISNRFMTTKSGATIRKMILEDFNIIHVWDFGDTRLFEAAVLPAVLLMKRKSEVKVNSIPKFTSIYSSNEAGIAISTETVFTALQKEGLVELADRRRFQVEQGKLNHGNTLEEVWCVSTKEFDDWMVTVKANTWATFRDIGDIKVGVKTTADKVFIRSDWGDMPDEDRPELLRPLITHHVARRFKSLRLDKPKEIVYPHCVVEGKRGVIDLKKYPRTAKYLNQHRSVLEARKYVIDAGRNWYEIWVPHDPEIWKQEKVVFRDISEKPIFWMDDKGAIVNGDCYWLTFRNPKQIDLLWLALAVGNSTFIESFYDRKFHNKLYAGRRRFITQYVEHFPLPDPAGKIGKALVKLAKRIHSQTPSDKTEKLEKDLDKLVWCSFGLSNKKISR